MSAQSATEEIRRGERFAFGDNWDAFLRLLDEERIRDAETSLRDHLGDLRGRRFLDAGCGSGLFSLAANRLGAQVTSFDFDPAAVECARSLRNRDDADPVRWSVTQGSVLDNAFLNSLGTFDVVYSWGVLHHTGQMWQALANVADMVEPDGYLFISIYNDQGPLSRFWKRVKRTYNENGPLTKRALAGAFATASRLRGNGPSRKDARGMDWWRDIVDWVGGYPYEVATPGEIHDFFAARGYTLRHLQTVVGHGCNQFVFQRMSPPPLPGSSA